MKRKLFTPLNVGPFDLGHRVVMDWGRIPAEKPDLLPHIISAMRDPVSGGGLAIFDPGPLIWPERIGLLPSKMEELRRIWRQLVAAAKAAGVSPVARLSADLAAEMSVQTEGGRSFRNPQIGQIIDAYVGAALKAKSAGFDGVELDGSHGSVTSLILRFSSSVRPNGHDSSVHRINFVVELVQALTHAFGRERVGIRLSPFRESEAPGVQGTIYGEALRALHDHEVSYVHFTDTEMANQFFEGTLHLTPLAEALRRAYPGILIASGRRISLPLAIELVERRWADGICFPGSELGGAFLERLRLAWERGSEL